MFGQGISAGNTQCQHCSKMFFIFLWQRDTASLVPESLEFSWEELHSFSYCATDFLSNFWALSWRKTALSYLLPPLFCPPLRQVQYLQSEGAEQPGMALTVDTVTLPCQVVSDETNPAGCLYTKALVSFTKISTGVTIAVMKCRQLLSKGQLLKCLMGVKNSCTNC